MIIEFRDNPNKKGELDEARRKSFIEDAYIATDEVFFGNRDLTELEEKMRAMTHVFYKILAEEPWADTYIRPSDIERKLSRYEMRKETEEIAAKNGWHSVAECVTAARKHLVKISKLPKGQPGDRGPFEDIDIIYVPGTVSARATNGINRQTTYPISVSSIAYILQTHICREMTKPYEMAEKFVSCNDIEWLQKLRKFVCDVVDFAPHLLDNSNGTLCIVLLALARSDITRRFADNGIRIEGSTISHRRADVLKQKFGWATPDERKPFDLVSVDLQNRIKSACFGPAGAIVKSRKPRGKSSAPPTPAPTTPAGPPPPLGFFASPPLGPPLGAPTIITASMVYGQGPMRPVAPSMGPPVGAPKAPAPLPAGIAKSRDEIAQNQGEPMDLS